MDRDTAIEKIKKCLALAASSNPNEAAAAMRQAQKLMAAFGVSGIEVELSDVKENAERAGSNVLTNWETSLANTVADAFGCRVVVSRRYLPRFMAKPERVTEWLFIGTSPGPDVAGYAFRVLLKQCASDRLAHVRQQSKRLKTSTRIARGDAFAIGWVHSVRDLLDRFVGTERQVELVEQYMSHRYPDLVQAKVHRREVNRHVRDDSYADGAAAGKNAKLNRGLNAHTKRSLLK